MKVLIIDDEQPAVNVLTSFIGRISYLDLKLGTTDATEGLGFLNENIVDLLFLDIEMPDITGLELLRSLDKKPMVVLTTAYEQYALQGYELDVIDYLVKPIRYERFEKAIKKANKLYELNKNFRAESTGGYILLKVDYKTIKIFYEDIIYIKGLKDYVKVYTSERMYLTRLNLKGIEAVLPPNLFIRVHRSYIIAHNRITSFQRGQLFVDKLPIPIGSTYVDKLEKFLKA